MSILEGNVSGSISGSLQLNGEGGTDNYNELDNKPQINGVTLAGNKNSEDINIIADVEVNGVSAVDPDMVARIAIPPTPTIPVTDVNVNGQSAMVGTVAEITIPPAPTIPVTDVKVNNQSAMVGTVAEITIPPTPTIPVEDVRVNNASVVSGGVADISVPVLDVTVDGESVVDANKVAAITLPSVPVQDVKVDGDSVVDAQGVADITLPNVPVQDVKVDGDSVVDAQGVADITMPNVPVQDVEYNGSSVVDAQGVAKIPAPGYPVTDVELNGNSTLTGTIANIEPTAADVSFDNAFSGYTATQSQDAIDEAASLIADLDTSVGDFSTPLDTNAQNCHDAINELKGTLVDKKAFDTETTSQMYQAITTSGGSLVSLTSTATATLTSNGASGVSVGYFKKASSGHVGFSIINYASLHTWTGRIVSDGTVEYLSSLASTTDLVTYKSLTLTARNRSGTSDCVIDAQNSYVKNSVAYIGITVHSGSNTQNIQILLPSGMKPKQNGIIGICGKGSSRWALTDAQYYYVGTDIGGLELNQITANTYYHIIATLPLAS